MQQQEVLLYEHSAEVKKQAAVKWLQELGLMTLIVNDQALKLLGLTCR